MCEAVGIPRYTPHNLRHSFGTQLLQNGFTLDQVARMGHSDPRTTMKHYVELAHLPVAMPPPPTLRGKKVMADFVAELTTANRVRKPMFP